MIASPRRYTYTPDNGLTTPDVLVLTNVSSTDTDLLRPLAALQTQSLQSWQWLIVASDSMASVVFDRCTQDSRVQVIAPANLPVILAASPCRFICLLEPVASLAPTFLEKAIWLLASNAQIACCNAHAIDESGHTWPYGFEQGERFLKANYVRPTAVFQRSDFLAIGIPLPSTTHEAWELWLRLAETGRWGVSIPEVLIHYKHLDLAVQLYNNNATASSDEHRQILARYQNLRGQYPHTSMPDLRAYEPVDQQIPIGNQLAKPGATTRLLIMMPWLIVGGAERVNLDLAHYLVEHGYELTFVTTLLKRQHPWEAEFRRFTPDIFILDHFLRLSDFPRFLVYLIRSRHIDIVMIANSYLGYQLLPFLRAHCPETTFVDQLHSYAEDWKYGGYPRASIGYQSQLDLTITSGDHVTRWMVNRGAKPDRIERCYTNVDTDRWRPDAARRKQMRTTLGVQNDAILIVFTGRLSGDKRPHLLPLIIQALQQRTHCSFHLAILGDGPERARIEHLVQAAQLGATIRLVGRVSDEEVFGYLAAADVFLLPSQTEGISVATFEAMAMGLIPISADVGGQGELITPTCGFLIPHGPDEVGQYADALACVMNDPELRHRMSLGARQRIEEGFALRDFGPQMAALFAYAQQLHTQSPRTAIDQTLACEWSTQVIEYTRQEVLLDEIWANLTVSPTSYQGLRRFLWNQLAGLYRWSVAHGMGWLVPIKDRVVAFAQRHNG